MSFKWIPDVSWRSCHHLASFMFSSAESTVLEGDVSATSPRRHHDHELFPVPVVKSHGDHPRLMWTCYAAASFLRSGVIVIVVRRVSIVFQTMSQIRRRACAVTAAPCVRPPSTMLKQLRSHTYVLLPNDESCITGNFWKISPTRIWVLADVANLYMFFFPCNTKPRLLPPD